MPRNIHSSDCLHRAGGAQLFMAPAWNHQEKSAKVHIVDVFALRIVSGYIKDPKGRLLLQSAPSVAEGRTWSLAKACQLVRNDANPWRWVILHQHKRAWGLFWAGGGLELCRNRLLSESAQDISQSIVPATPDTLLKLVLEVPDLIDDYAAQASPSRNESKLPHDLDRSLPWKAIVCTSLIWLFVIAALSVSIEVRLHRQSDLLRQLLERKGD